jgi:superfamily II DNA or RNA helicase
MKKWDGFVDFFSEKTGRFLTGLLPEVKMALKNSDKAYFVDDRRKLIDFKVKSVDEDWLNQGKPKDLDPVFLRDYQVDYINQVIRNRRGIIHSPTSSGKAQPLDSLVYTPHGHMQIGKLKNGDLVCSADGLVTEVKVFDRGKKPVYRIYFDTLDFVEACGEHLWLVNDMSSGRVNQLLNTSKLIAGMVEVQGKSRYTIPVASIAYFNQSYTAIHNPYVLGVVLAKWEVVNNEVVCSFVDFDLYQNFSGNRPSSILRARTPGEVKIDCAAIGLSIYEEPYIPDAYIYTDFQSRVFLLQGLMDASGDVNANGEACFITPYRRLAFSFKKLIESIGGLCFIKKDQDQYVCKITIPCVEFLFKLEKKRANVPRVDKYKVPLRRTITAIEPVGERETRCIALRGNCKLYLTDNFVVTHNTNVIVGTLKALPEDCRTLFLVNNTSLLEQNYDEISKWNIFPKVGRFYGRIKDLQNITCATVQSCHLLEDWLKDVQALLVDEIHDLMSPQALKVYNQLSNACIRMGTSATPFRYGERDKVHKYKVKGHIGPVFLAQSTETGRLTTKELQERRILSSDECTFFYVREPKLPYAIFGDAVTYGIAQNEVLHDIVCKLVSTLSGRNLILVERIAHGDRLQELIPGALWVRGQDTPATRKEVLERLREEKGKVVAIATQKIFNTGINVFLHQLINAAGGQADHQIIQRLGRGLRRTQDKQHLRYYDFYFLNNEYLEKHSARRVSILEKEGHPVVVKEYIF